jgi:hypothetical protein
MRPRSPAARNAFRNQISSLVKSTVIKCSVGTIAELAAAGPRLPAFRPARLSAGQAWRIIAPEYVFKNLAVERERDSLDPYLAALKGDFCVLRVGLVIAVMLFGESAALAAEPMAPNEIKAAFFTGQPFTAVSPSGAKFKMVFTADGRTTREPFEQSGKGSAGTWKLNAKGFCTAWNHAKPNCFTVVPSGQNKWSVQKIATTIATTVAVWSK